jgi:hypothetical protein
VSSIDRYIEVWKDGDPEDTTEWLVLLMQGGQLPEPPDAVDVLGTFPTLNEARAFAGREAAERGLEVFEEDLGGGYPPAAWEARPS